MNRAAIEAKGKSTSKNSTLEGYIVLIKGHTHPHIHAYTNKGQILLLGARISGMPLAKLRG